MFRNALKKRRWKLFLLSMKGWKLEKERGAGPSQELKASGISPPHRQLDGQFPVPSVLLPTSSCPEASSCLLNPGMLHIADLHWELGRGQVAAGFWVPSLLILLEAEPSRPGPVQTGGRGSVSLMDCACSRHLKFPASLPLCPQVFPLSQSCPELLQCYRSPSGCPHSPSLCQTDEEQLY